MDENETDDKHAVADCLLDDAQGMSNGSLPQDDDSTERSAPAFLADDQILPALTSEIDTSTSYDVRQEPTEQSVADVFEQTVGTINQSDIDSSDRQESAEGLPGVEESVQAVMLSSTGQSSNTADQPTGPLASESHTLDEAIDLLKAMNKDFQTKILKTEKESQIIDQMHAELQSYKNDFYAKLTMPILKRIITLREDILKLTADYMQKPEDEQFIPLRTFASFSSDLAMILEDSYIELYSYQAGDAFDPQRQRIVEPIETNNPELNKTIARTIGDGYSFNGQTVSPQRVEVYSFKQVAEVKTQQGEEERNG